jgi:signal transduction histidine kinase
MSAMGQANLTDVPPGGHNHLRYEELPFTDRMQIVTPLMAFVTLVVGVGVLWANPRRFTNQVFFAFSVLIGLYLWFIYQAKSAGVLLAHGRNADPVYWLRVIGIPAAFFPWALWLLKESCITVPAEWLRTIVRTWPWFVAAIVLSVIPFTESFIPLDSTPANPKRGIGYIVSVAAFSILFGAILIQALIQLRKQTGIRRVELQFLVMNMGAAGIIAAIFYMASTVFHLLALKQFAVVAMPASFGLTAWALAFHRVFDARQVVLALGQRMGVVSLSAVGAIGFWRLFSSLGSPVAVVTVSAVGCVVLALWLDRRSRQWLDLGGEKRLVEMRRAVIQITYTETEPARLVARFDAFLAELCDAKFSALLLDRGPAHTSEALIFSKQRRGHAALCEIGWATRESLQRRRSSPGVDDLDRFMTEHSLGLLVSVPRGSPAPSLILALGTKMNEQPYTYPEIQRLQNVAELMDNILMHARMAADAALKAKTEHLAMMSRGLAHDLKNLLTPVASFLVHTDGQFPARSDAAEVHKAACRSVRTIEDYVRASLFFADRLTPKFEEVDLGRVFEATREVTAEQAAQRGVTVELAMDCHAAVTADRVLLQRMLVNLVRNAIDASRRGQTVLVWAADGRSGWLQLRVVDDGCGIAVENLPRMFTPYFTTKRFGDDVRGFGLGLAICEKIVQLHGGVIAVQSVVDRGTTFTIDLPVTHAEAGVESSGR